MKTKIKISPSARRELRALGDALRRARLRRELSQKLVAERASIGVQTLIRIEAGDPAVAMGSYAMVIGAVGLLGGWGDLVDPVGDDLAHEQMRKRAPRRKS